MVRLYLVTGSSWIGNQVKVTESANATFGTWREGNHVSFVLAIACAAWMAELTPLAEIKIWFGPEDCGAS